MLAKDASVHDEFQLEVNRMRNSLNALTLKNFMFDGMSRGNHDDEAVEVERKELIPIKPLGEEPVFKRNLSKHRQDASRTKSSQFNNDDVLTALIASQEKLDEKPKARVHFVEEVTEPKKNLAKDPSRDSDEVANINGLPWQKKYEYRTVTPFFKAKNKQKATSNENLQAKIAFRPIETSRSIEDVNKAIVKPVPIFASKSYQELPTSWEFKPFDHFQTKSIDDLLLNNIDGARKPESKRHKLVRLRSTSNTSINRHSDQQIYENFYYDIPEVPLSALDNHPKKKAPLPLPRVTSEERISDDKRSSKKIVYVLDKKRDEFVLEEPDEATFDDVYENVLLRNNIDQDRDSILFNSLLVDSREDCKLRSL